MRIIEEFKSRVPEAQGDNLVLQRFFLHQLFPDTYGITECLALRAEYENIRSYKLVAADGYHWAIRGTGGFTKGMDWLVEIDCPVDLCQHEVALLGIALGLARTCHQAWEAWWKCLLKEIEFDRKNLPLSNLLSVVSGIAAASDPSMMDDAYSLAAGMLREPKQWNRDRLAAYLNRMRKEAFPYYDDFFKTMLSVYVMDCAFETAVKSPEELLQLQEEAVAHRFEIAMTSLDAYADRKARVVVLAMTVLLLTIAVWVCFWFFVLHPRSPDFRNYWDVLKWCTLLINGPGALLGLLGRMTYFARRKQPILMDLQLIQGKFKKWIVKRWCNRLRLPLPINA